MINKNQITRAGMIVRNSRSSRSQMFFKLHFKVAFLQACEFTKKRPQRKRLTVKFATFLITLLFTEHLQ